MAGNAYRGWRWRDARALALDRARYRCERCGDQQTLVVHHRDACGMSGARAYDPSNLTVLCRPCHRREHGVLPPRD